MGAFHAYNRSKGLAPRTVESYGKRLEGFRRWFVKEYGEEVEITARRIREFAAARLESGVKPGTVRCQLEALRVFYGFLVEDEVISPRDNPMRLVKSIRVPPPEIEPLTTDQLNAFLACFNQSSPTDYRNYIICLLILDTGLRAGEALGLTLSNVDLKEGKISVVGKGNKKRTVYVGEKMREKLRDYLQRCRPWIANGHFALFPSAGARSKQAVLTSKYLAYIVTDKFDQIGVKRASSASHRLRHTFAVFYLRNGGDAFSLQRLLGLYQEGRNWLSCGDTTSWEPSHLPGICTLDVPNRSGSERFSVTHHPPS